VGLVSSHWKKIISCRHSLIIYIYIYIYIHRWEVPYLNPPGPTHLATPRGFAAVYHDGDSKALTKYIYMRGLRFKKKG